MRYRTLGNTGLSVSEVGFGGEWLLGTQEETRTIMERARELGVNIIDCWMCDPRVRSNLGYGMRGHRDDWIVQGHFGSVWKDGQYVRTREMADVVPAFEDELRRLESDHFELGMIHYIDDEEDFDRTFNGPFIDYVLKQKEAGVIDHIGMSTHRPEMGLKAIETGIVEMMLFSVNPAFDMMPSTTELDTMLGDEADFSAGGTGIDAVRAKFYATCAERGIGLTVMKPFAGGRLLDANLSPFGVALTPAQCIHYALTRPAVASVLVGHASVEQVEQNCAYETATPDELDYASVLASAPAHGYAGQCTYCGHCAPCAVGIEIPMVNKFADLAKMQDEVPASVRGHYEALEVRADACIQCHACEPRCPFGVRSADRMVEAAELFA